METITQLFAAEQLRTMTCGPEQGLIKNWQDSLKKQQTAGMPAHEVDVSKPPEKDNMSEAMRNVFLHQAAGGPKEGFTTKNPRSHAVAQSLAKTGHLKKVGEFKHANNQAVHHWQLTEKGLAHAQTGGQGGFPVTYPKAAGGMPVTTKSPGDPSKGAAPGATAKNGLGQPDPKQKFKVAAGGPGSGRHPGPGTGRPGSGSPVGERIKNDHAKLGARIKQRQVNLNTNPVSPRTQFYQQHLRSAKNAHSQAKEALSQGRFGDAQKFHATANQHLSRQFIE